MLFVGKPTIKINLKIVNLKRENRDRKKVLKQGEDSGTL